MTGIDRRGVEAWQTWLALEHEAVWLYGLIGGRVSDLDEDAVEAWNRHRDTRDRLISLIRAAGADPVGPQLGYAVRGINSTASARSAAQDIENKVATATLGCMSDTTLRSEVIAALRSSAETSAEWGAPPTAFPGLPLRAAE